MEIGVDGKKYKVLLKIPVLHEGWECDNTYYVVEKDGKAHLVTSNHGRLSFSKNAKGLEEKIKEYKECLNKTKEALKILYNQEKP